ncbi:MAG: 1,4-dihydroxy-6-naphthoate synthase [Rikenellaceae bacterium]|jgi:1,4-dihydroxy-6-naphthoate synthase|nr:1,4-dihydroxy-6-naphthoate synthase [Rikenellaceae bacterium]
MTLTLSISPCPNDTFMFDALVNGRIDTRGLEFAVSYADIEELNRGVMSGGGVDISKISYAVLPEIAGRYRLLDSGSALGRGNGPLLVAREGVDIHSAGVRVVVPGFYTTANLLLRRLYPELTNVESLLFSSIAPSIAAGDFDAGVLIHEGRFTYQKYGLQLVADLGEEWEAATGLPLPLGAIVVSRDLPEGVQTTVEELIRESVQYALDRPIVSRDYVKSHAAELSDEVIDSHIRLFVNDFSLSLPLAARRAVTALTGVCVT